MKRNFLIKWNPKYDNIAIIWKGGSKKYTIYIFLKDNDGAA